MVKKQPQKKRLSDQLRRVIADCGLSRYRISKETGVAEETLSRFMSAQRRLSLNAVVEIGELLDLEVVAKKRSQKKKASQRKRVSDQLRRLIADCGLPRDRISKEISVSEKTLEQFMSDQQGLSSTVLDQIGELLDLEVVMHGPSRSRANPVQ